MISNTTDTTLPDLPLSEVAASRRTILRGAAFTAIAALTPMGLAGVPTSSFATGAAALRGIQSDLVNDIESILQAQGSVSNGVLSIEIDRNDITNVKLHGVEIKPSFQINGSLCFQVFPGQEQVMFNGDVALKADELVPFNDALVAHDVIFQAEHQHFYDFEPMVWFIHFRAFGDADKVAQGIKAALNTTSTPFPQTMPSNPTTPLPAKEIAAIIGGDYSIGSDGVVTVDIPREEAIHLGGKHINPYLNVQTNVPFQPLDSQGTKAAAAPDFGMIAREVEQVVRVMRHESWDVGCLYNQETDEHPQLYFSHMFKTGDPISLARQIRHGLDQMHVKFK